jgi:hypothetical protein
MTQQPTNKTLRNALAFVAITSSKRKLHVTTRLAMYDFLMPFDLKRFGVMVNDEGQKLVEQTALWKAHQKLLAMGFRLDVSRKHAPNFISYVHTEHLRRHAWIGRNARAYAYMPIPSTDNAPLWSAQPVAA